MSGEERTFHVPARLMDAFSGTHGLVWNPDGSATFTAREGCVMPHDGIVCDRCDWVRLA